MSPCCQWDEGAGSTASISFTSFLLSGALLKAAFICTQVVQFPSQRPLRAQLMESFGGGFEVHTWSKLPHGSGLGRFAGKGLGSPSLVPGSLSCCQHQEGASPSLPPGLQGHNSASLPCPHLCTLQAPAASWQEQ